MGRCGDGERRRCGMGGFGLVAEMGWVQGRKDGHGGPKCGHEQINRNEAMEDG